MTHLSARELCTLARVAQGETIANETSCTRAYRSVFIYLAGNAFLAAEISLGDVSCEPGCKTLLRVFVHVCWCAALRQSIRRLFVIGSMARAVAARASGRRWINPTVFRPCVSFFVASRLFSCFLIIGLRVLDAQCTPFQLDRDYKSIR